MKKKWLFGLGLALALALGVVVLTGCEPGSSASGQITGLNLSSQQEGIFVSGAGKATAVPDVATLSLGIEAQAATVAAAQSQAASAMDKVMASLTSNGVAKKDIQTQYFNISRVSRWDEKTQQEVVIGYRVTNVVTAKIRNLDKAGSIIDAVAIAGGDLTRINGISFSVEDPSSYYAEARKLAMADAKAKANQLASAAGVTLGKATYISENTYTPPIAAPMALKAEALAAPETPISPGEMEITTTVQITFAIK